jgi:hypothetical protein
LLHLLRAAYGTTRASAKWGRCPQLVGADISSKMGDSRFDPFVPFEHRLCCGAQRSFGRRTIWYV